MRAYENAPATRMLATHCVCCGRPLVDAVSVEAGVGPDCRKKYGYAEAQGKPDFVEAVKHTPADFIIKCEDVRGSVNRLVHRAALASLRKAVSAKQEVVGITKAVRALGYTKLADAMASRMAKVIVTVEGPVLKVRAPYNEVFVEGARLIVGARYIGERTTQFPVSEKQAVWALIRRCYAGQTLSSAKGIAVIQ